MQGRGLVRYFICVLFVIVSCWAYAQNSQNTSREALFSTIQTVKFDDITYHLAYKNASEVTTFREYLPEGETFENNQWKKMFGIYIYPNHKIDPVSYGEAVIERARKRDPSMPHHVFHFKQKDCQSIVVEFMLTEIGVPSFFEQNIFYFTSGSKTEEGKNILGYQYVQRFYFPPDVKNLDEAKAWYYKKVKEWVDTTLPTLVEKFQAHGFTFYDDKGGAVEGMTETHCQS